MGGQAHTQLQKEEPLGLWLWNPEEPEPAISWHCAGRTLKKLLDFCNSQMLSSSSCPGSPSCPAGDLCTYNSKAGRRTPHLPSKLKPPGPLKKALKMLFGSNSTEKRKNSWAAVKQPSHSHRSGVVSSESLRVAEQGAQGWLPAPGAMQWPQTGKAERTCHGAAQGSG